MASSSSSGQSVSSEREKQISIVEFLTREGEDGPKRIYDRLNSVYGKKCLKKENIFKLHRAYFSKIASRNLPLGGMVEVHEGDPLSLSDFRPATATYATTGTGSPAAAAKVRSSWPARRGGEAAEPPPLRDEALISDVIHRTVAAAETTGPPRLLTQDETEDLVTMANSVLTGKSGTAAASSSSSSKAKKRTKYSLLQKLQAIDYLYANGKRATLAHYQIEESTLRSWNKNESAIRLTLAEKGEGRRRLKGGGRKVKCSELEARLADYIRACQAQKIRVTQKVVQEKGVEIWAMLQAEGIVSRNDQFRASQSWLRRFLARHIVCPSHYFVQENSEVAQQISNTVDDWLKNLSGTVDNLVMNCSLALSEHSDKYAMQEEYGGAGPSAAAGSEDYSGAVRQQEQETNNEEEDVAVAVAKAKSFASNSGREEIYVEASSPAVEISPDS